MNIGCIVRTHGESHSTPEWRAWMKMRERCLSRLSKDFRDYGGRGIAICARWNSYPPFLEDMGRKPSPLHSLGRIDNDGPYSPENCAWQTPKEQARNRRTSHRIAFNGETLTIAGWSERKGWDPRILCHRIWRGWSAERALTQPLRIHADGRYI